MCVYESDKVLFNNGLISLDLSELSNGVYFLVLQDEKIMFTKRLLLRK